MRWDYIKLAITNLKQRQLRSWLTMIGIFIGIAMVVALISLGAGLKAAIAAQFSSLGTDKIIIAPKGGGFGPPGQGAAVQLYKKDLAVIKRSQDIKVATGRLLDPIQVYFNQKHRVVFMASIPEDPQERQLVLDSLNVNAAQGRIPKAGDGYRVVIGAQYTTSDDFGKPLTVGDTLIINNKKVTVVGVLARKGSNQVDRAFIMTEQSYRDLLNITDDHYSFLVAQVTSPEAVPVAVQSVTKDLRSSRGVKERKEDFTVQTPGDILNSFNTIIGGVTAVLVGIAAISLVVGGIGIMNTMYTAVLERTKEIGIMKAVGARNSHVLSIFLFESGLLGLLGGIIGIILGVILSQIVVLAGVGLLGPGILRAEFSPLLMFGALAFSFVVGAAAGTLPAYEAAKLPPVEALRQ